MSLGRTSTFLDVYLERDLAAGRARPRQQAQELIDDFVIKLRIVRFLRTPEYDELFSGDPTWVTESIGGIGEDGRPLVTRTRFRYLQTLYNLGPAPEPNLTVFWIAALPDGLQAVLRPGLDRHLARSSTSPTTCMRAALGRRRRDRLLRLGRCAVGKQMQFFGARVNLAKTLLYAINGGRDEITGAAGRARPARRSPARCSTTTTSWPRFDTMMDWLAETYVDALNCIHYMHDKYAYERLEMALHD